MKVQVLGELTPAVLDFQPEADGAVCEEYEERERKWSRQAS
jgi:hypothetical protein